MVMIAVTFWVANRRPKQGMPSTSSKVKFLRYWLAKTVSDPLKTAFHDGSNRAVTLSSCCRDNSSNLMRIISSRRIKVGDLISQKDESLQP